MPIARRINSKVISDLGLSAGSEFAYIRLFGEGEVNPSLNVMVSPERQMVGNGNTISLAVTSSEDFALSDLDWTLPTGFSINAGEKVGKGNYLFDLTCSVTGNTGVNYDIDLKIGNAEYGFQFVTTILTVDNEAPTLTCDQDTTGVEILEDFTIELSGAWGENYSPLDYLQVWYEKDGDGTVRGRTDASINNDGTWEASITFPEPIASAQISAEIADVCGNTTTLANFKEYLVRGELARIDLVIGSSPNENNWYNSEVPWGVRADTKFDLEYKTWKESESEPATWTTYADNNVLDENNVTPTVGGNNYSITSSGIWNIKVRAVSSIEEANASYELAQIKVDVDDPTWATPGLNIADGFGAVKFEWNNDNIDSFSGDETIILKISNTDDYSAAKVAATVSAETTQYQHDDLSDGLYYFFLDVRSIAGNTAENVAQSGAVDVLDLVPSNLREELTVKEDEVDGEYYKFTYGLNNRIDRIEVVTSDIATIVGVEYLDSNGNWQPVQALFVDGTAETNPISGNFDTTATFRHEISFDKVDTKGVRVEFLDNTNAGYVTLFNPVETVAAEQFIGQTFEAQRGIKFVNDDGVSAIAIDNIGIRGWLDKTETNTFALGLDGSFFSGFKGYTGKDDSYIEFDPTAAIGMTFAGNVQVLGGNAATHTSVGEDIEQYDTDNIQPLITGLGNDLDEYADDGYISLPEANSIKLRLQELDYEDNQLITTATNLSVSTTAYENAFTALEAEVTHWIDQASYPIEIAGSGTTRAEVISAFETLQDEKTKLLDAIVLEREGRAKQYTDDFADTLGEAAYINAYTEALDGVTLISGGVIQTSLLDVADIFAQNVNITGELTMGVNGLVQSNAWSIDNDNYSFGNGILSGDATTLDLAGWSASGTKLSSVVSNSGIELDSNGSIVRMLAASRTNNPLTISPDAVAPTTVPQIGNTQTISSYTVDTVNSNNDSGIISVGASDEGIEISFSIEGGTTNTTWVKARMEGRIGTGSWNTISEIQLPDTRWLSPTEFFITGNTQSYDDIRLNFQVYHVSQGSPSWDITSIEAKQYETVTVINKNGITVRNSPNSVLRFGGGYSQVDFQSSSSNVVGWSNVSDKPFSSLGNGLSVSSETLSVDMSVFDTGDLSEGSNLYYTDQRVKDLIAPSNDFQALGTGDDVQFRNIELTGVINYANETNLQIEDKTITLNKNGTDTSSSGAGIIIERDSADETMTWSPADGFTFSSKVSAGSYSSDEWNTAYGWGDWEVGVDKAFVDALNVDADLLDGEHGSFYRDAGNLNAGTILSARVSGNYTEVTGVGALNAGSITSGFGNIDIGSSTINSGVITANAGAGNLVASFISTDRFAQIYLSDDTTTEGELFRRDGDKLSIYTGGNQALFFNASGKTFVPNSLDVTGTGDFSGNIHIQGGSSKRVILTDTRTGNAEVEMITGARGIIGTTTNHEFNIKTNGTEVAKFLPNGDFNLLSGTLNVTDGTRSIQLNVSSGNDYAQLLMLGSGLSNQNYFISYGEDNGQHPEFAMKNNQSDGILSFYTDSSKQMEILSSGAVNFYGDAIFSTISRSFSGFASGFAGNGTQVDFADNTLTTNTLTIRERMNVYEQMVNQIRSTNGSLWVSSSTKITSVQSLAQGFKYRCYVEENRFVPFVEGDIIEGRRSSGKNQYQIKGVVVDIENGSSTVTNNSIERYFDIVLIPQNDCYKTSEEIYENDILYTTTGYNASRRVSKEEGLDTIEIYDVNKQDLSDWRPRYDIELPVKTEEVAGIFWAKSKSGSFNVSIGLMENGSTKKSSSGTTLNSSSWTPVYIQYSNPSSYSMNRISLRINDAISNESIWVTGVQWFTPNSGSPESGMEFTRTGSSTDSDRQGSVYLTADDNGAPFIDIIDGVSTEAHLNYNPSHKSRFGNLSGISDPIFGSLQGYGSYIQNLYATGNAQIAGTLTAGDANGVGNTFYAGRIRKNLVLYSEGSGSWHNAPTGGITALWQSSSGTYEATSKSTSLPDGTTGTVPWIRRTDSGGGNIRLYLSNSRVGGISDGDWGGRTITVSFWLKCDPELEGLTVGDRWSIPSDDAIGYHWSHTLSTEWRRVTTTFTVPEDVSGYPRSYFGDNSDFISTTDGIYIWGMQVEEGISVSAYQPTDGTILSSDSGFGMWARAGGIGGTIQNPVLNLTSQGIDYNNKIFIGEDRFSSYDNALHIYNLSGDSPRMWLKRDSNNYVGMYWNTTSDWGIRGRVGGEDVIDIGATNKIAGWDIDANRLAGNNGSQYIYIGDMSSGGNAWSSSVYGIQIGTSANNRIWMGISGSEYDFNVRFGGDDIVTLGTRYGNSIAGWNFDASALYTGTKVNNGEWAAAGDITIGSSGYISANKFRLFENGNAEFKGNITGGQITGGSLTLSTDGVITNSSGDYIIDEDRIYFTDGSKTASFDAGKFVLTSGSYQNFLEWGSTGNFSSIALNIGGFEIYKHNSLSTPDEGTFSLTTDLDASGSMQVFFNINGNAFMEYSIFGPSLKFNSGAQFNSYLNITNISTPSITGNRLWANNGGLFWSEERLTGLKSTSMGDNQVKKVASGVGSFQITLHYINPIAGAVVVGYDGNITKIAGSSSIDTQSIPFPPSGTDGTDGGVTVFLDYSNNDIYINNREGVTKTIYYKIDTK